MDTTGAGIAGVADMADYPGAETRLQVDPVTDDATSDTNAIRPPHALLFDMDGTLTEPALDYPEIKAAMGIPLERPILEALAEMSPARRATAEAVLHEYEDRAARESV